MGNPRFVIMVKLKRCIPPCCTCRDLPGPAGACWNPPAETCWDLLEPAGTCQEPAEPAGPATEEMSLLRLLILCCKRLQVGHGHFANKTVH